MVVRGGVSRLTQQIFIRFHFAGVLVRSSARVRRKRGKDGVVIVVEVVLSLARGYQ